MNRRYRVVIFSSLMLIATRTLADSLCDVQEQTLFTCKTKNKQASICASKVISENTGYLRYLYGNQKKIELEYPKANGLARQNFKWSKSWSPGVNVYLKFAIGKFKYYVYSSQGESYGDRRNPNSIYHWERNGIAVFRNATLQRNIECTESDSGISAEIGINAIESSKVPIDDETDFNLWAALL
jgi:hypothetical protein